MIRCKWLFKMKDGIPGVKINRYKARYVVRGFDQREGIDFNEVFSLVVRHTSIRVLLSIVALQDLEMEQLDVKKAFLYGHLEEEIYVKQPEGFKVPGKGGPYGSFLYLVIYVNDMLIAAPNKDQIRELKDQLSNKFEMNDLGTDYISKVLKKFNMSSCKPVPNPLAPHFKLSSHECLKSEEDMSRVPYSSAVGSLMYAMVCTRPDLAHAVSVVSRYMHNPGKMHWKAVKSLSTTEAEYISSTEGVKEAIWLRGMVNEFGLPQELALRGAATTAMKSYGFWFKVEIVEIVSQKL
uniref:Retrotransposon protein, putative, Ty1-copia subclass n=1 Tax=Tanacetum cinerariifolium TaxID=118510 RepID=A0A6L2M0F7_TANCI|nr:retrotransposon protein, putative, Ty1-copia subclass [Tanacetum cinerariifolium]